MKIPPSVDECVGCGLCAEVCPKNCITMKNNKQGFLEPVVDKTNCVNCGLCEKKCPVIQPKDKIKPLTAYALKEKNEQSRLKSASGGAASVFAKHIIENGGVYSGVKLDNQFNAVHDICDNIENIDLFRDSKYIQSDMTGIFGKIKEALIRGQKVFATGTPCQIAALRRQFGYDNENLILCDLVCQGVPTPLVLKKQIELLESRTGNKIEKFYFRDKTNGWEKSNVKVVYENGSEDVIERKDSEFFRIFSHNISMRKACYNCKFRDFNLYSDITIGDYWGIDKKYPEFNDDKGCSLVIVNTPRGKALFEDVLKNVDVIETGVDFAVETHPKLLRSVLENPYRKTFFSKFNKDIGPKAFKKIVEDFTGAGIISRIKRKLFY